MVPRDDLAHLKLDSVRVDSFASSSSFLQCSATRLYITTRRVGACSSNLLRLESNRTGHLSVVVKEFEDLSDSINFVSAH